MPAVRSDSVSSPDPPAKRAGAACSRTQFGKWVHDALSRLYDTPYLQTHPLADVLLAGEADSRLLRSQALRRTLLEALETMRPAPGTPAQSPAWRAYRILELRYIEGLTPAEAMKRLALARSQFFHEQGRMLEALADILWERGRQTQDIQQAAESGRRAMARSETERLSARARWQEIDVAALLEELLPVVGPLVATRGAGLSIEPPVLLHSIAADRVMLRQIVLNMVSCALDACPGSHIRIGEFSKEGSIGLRIVAARGARAAAAEPPASASSLEICHQLAAALGARLALCPGPDRWEARLAWEAKALRTLLVVDDNEGLIALFRRYLAGHDWQVIGTTSSAGARQAVAAVSPTAIALDLMMPGEDGWDLLLSLKTDPATRPIPVIVCSVLSQPHLAERLGAAAFLPKPVSQQALLQALAPWG